MTVYGAGGVGSGGVVAVDVVEKKKEKDGTCGVHACPTCMRV